VDYLVKPYPCERFLVAIARSCEDHAHYLSWRAIWEREPELVDRRLRCGSGDLSCSTGQQWAAQWEIWVTRYPHLPVAFKPLSRISPHESIPDGTTPA
jgi:hypothetical protein